MAMTIIRDLKLVVLVWGKQASTQRESLREVASGVLNPHSHPLILTVPFT